MLSESASTNGALTTKIRTNLHPEGNRVVRFCQKKIYRDRTVTKYQVNCRKYYIQYAQFMNALQQSIRIKVFRHLAVCNFGGEENQLKFSPFKNSSFSETCCCLSYCALRLNYFLSRFPELELNLLSTVPFMLLFQVHNTFVLAF